MKTVELILTSIKELLIFIIVVTYFPAFTIPCLGILLGTVIVESIEYVKDDKAYKMLEEIRKTLEDTGDILIERELREALDAEE